MILRVGTRSSLLATTQTETVADTLRARGHDVERILVTTHGDTDRASLTAQGGQGVFAAALRQALRAGRVDFAVHSFKDLPTAPHPGLTVVAVPPREESADALCAREGLTLATLPHGARIGTGSPRRVAQLRAIRPDLVAVDIRGNIDTRLARVADGDCDAVVLAAAGLRRLGRAHRITELLPMLPAAAQGALAIECRTSDVDDAIGAALTLLDHPPAHAAALAEREVLAALSAGCAAPVGALARHTDDGLELRAGVFAPDGTSEVVATQVGDAAHPVPLGRRVAEQLLRNGADTVADLQASLPGHVHDDKQLWQPPAEQQAPASPLAGATLLWLRAPDAMSAALEGAGARVICQPLIRIEPDWEAVAAARRAIAASTSAWLVLTSPRAVDVVGLGALPTGVRVAAVGPGTAAAVRSAGARVDFVPQGTGGAALVAEFPAPDVAGMPVILPVSAAAAPTVAAGLTGRGYTVEAFGIYAPQPVELPAATAHILHTGIDLAVVSAGSVAAALAAHTTSIPVVAFGSPSATGAEEAGLRVCAVASAVSPAAMVEACTTALRSNP